MTTTAPQPSTLNKLTQFALPALTIGGQLATALKYPQFGLIINLVSQPFWLYSGYKAHKQAGQTGILITSVIFTIVTIMGVVNYWWM